MPFLFSDGFIEMVLFNDKNSLIFDSAFAIGKLNLLLPILSILIIYMHFFNQAKINNDLLFFYFGILFACILLLVYPSPAWYLWAIPFICIYFINAKNFNKALMLYITFSFAYLVFFIFFYHGDYADIYVLNKPLNLKIEHKNLSDISYTILESILLCIIYVFYKHGIKSNSIYKRKQNLSIGIGGDSGAGKSTLLNLLKNMLGDRLLCLEGDGEHKWERGNSAWEKFTHLDPKANLLHNQSDFITELKNNNAIYRRDYDHTSGKFSTPQLLKPKPFLVIAGLHPFYLPKMRKSLDLKIYLDTDENLRIHWKILRDKARGHSKKSVELAIAKREQDKQKYITPQKAFSDLIISFSTQEAIEIGNKNTKINLALHITLNASVNLAPLLEVLVCEWDYNNDLKTQFLLLKSQPNLDFNALALQMIENINEITENLSLPSGYDGLIGLIILILIAQNLKDEQ